MISVATAGFFPLDLGFLVSSGFLGIFVSNLGFFHLLHTRIFFRVGNSTRSLAIAEKTAVQFIVDSVQGRPRTKVTDLDPNRKRVYDFLIVINSNLGPGLHRFGVRTTYWPKIATPSH